MRYSRRMIRESHRPYSRMLREARKAKPKYFQGYHVMHADLGSASGDLGDKIKGIVFNGILNKLNELFEDNFGRKMDISYDERSDSYNFGENVSVEEWFAKWRDIFADKIYDEMDDAEILVPNKRVKSAEFNKIERRVKDRYSMSNAKSMADAKVWWGAIEAAKRIVSEFEWDKDDDLYDAEVELLAIEGLEGKSDEDMDESLNRHGRMLKEDTDEMPIPYLIGQAKFEDGWSPMVVYLNWNNDRYWYEASVIDAGGVYFTELGRGFVVSKVKPGTDKCDPEETEAVKRVFFNGCSDQGLPVREVKTVRELGRYAPDGRELHSRD